VTGAAQLRAVQWQHGAKRGAYVIFLLAELDPSKDPSLDKLAPIGKLASADRVMYFLFAIAGK